MRVFLTYMMLILFVGSHWLADLKPHFHQDLENSATIESNASAPSATIVNNIETASIEALSSRIFDDCCAISDQADAASDIHCMADCGLATSGHEAYRPNPGLYLALPADFPTASNAASNPFRPPIV